MNLGDYSELPSGKLIKMKGKKLGVVTKDLSFICWRNFEKHFFRMYKGFGFSVLLINNLKSRGVEQIKIIVRYPDKKERVFVTTVEDVFKFGIPYENPKLPEERQLILPTRSFRKVI